MNNRFDYTLEPGKELKKSYYSFKEPIVSVIVPFYNSKQYIGQTIRAILNQTFPMFELLIIDDGSTDKESLKELERIKKIDERIKVYHKENGGLSSARDFGAEQASRTTKYFFFIDDDDLVEQTFLECAYWTLETNPNAGWAYSDSVGFGKIEYTWNKWFDSQKLKHVNELLSCALIRKEAYYSVNGYELREKAVNEDWNFWLKLIAKGYYPVHMSFYGLWYRRKDNGELVKASTNRKRTLEIIHETAKTIKNDVDAVQYPRYVFDGEVVENFDTILSPISSNKKTNILMFIPWMVMGGADFFNLELLKRLDKNRYNVIVVSSIPSVNPLRQEIEKYATVYDLTSFLDRKYWLSFVNYIIKKECIHMIFCTNSMFGYSLLPYLKLTYPTIPILDYIHMEEWYYRDGGYARMSSNYKDVIDKTLVCNKRTENVLINAFAREKKEVSTVYIGVDTDKFDATKYNKKTYLEKFSIPKNKFVISYICRISEQKRPLLLFEIMKETLSKRDDIVFLVVGEGDMLDTLKDRVYRANFQSSVLFLGKITNTFEVYRVSDITLNCSIKEGLALTTYESLAMGVPVITADVGGQKELVDETVGAVVPCLQEEKNIKNFNYSKEEIYNYVDAINQIINSLDILKDNCRKKVLNNFTLNQMATNMMAEIETVMRSKIKKCLVSKEDTMKSIIDEFNYDINSTYYLIRLYQKEIYGRYYVDNRGVNICSYKKELLREKLWQNKLWRKLVNSSIWKKVKKIIHK